MTVIRNANIRKVDIGMLAALHLMLEQRSLSSVAREIRLSQPALSHALARLRKAFGDDLLVRDRNTLVPTVRANALREHLAALVPELLTLFALAEFDPAISTQTFKLAITDHAGQILLSALLKRITEEAPQVLTNVAMIPNRQTDLADLDEGQYDIRIGWLRSLPPQWLKRKLCDDRIVLVGARENPQLPKRKQITTEQFLDLGFVALDSNRPIYPNLVDSYLAENGWSRKVVARVSHFSFLPSIIANTALVAMLPERLALEFASAGTLRIIDPPMKFPDSHLSLAWHPRVHNDPGHMWLRQLIIDCADALPDPGEIRKTNRRYR